MELRDVMLILKQRRKYLVRVIEERIARGETVFDPMTIVRRQRDQKHATLDFHHDQSPDSVAERMALETALSYLEELV